VKPPGLSGALSEHVGTELAGLRVGYRRGSPGEESGQEIRRKPKIAATPVTRVRHCRRTLVREILKWSLKPVD
jgi:hypothetical protein